jgi:hypothetical protein
MRTCRLFAALLFAAPLALAQQTPDPAPRSGAQRARNLELIEPAELRAPPAPQPNEAEPLSHRHYKAKDGHEVHAPARSTHDQAPAGASAKCRDGTYSFSQHRRGTCSHHGGVASWL